MNRLIITPLVTLSILSACGVEDPSELDSAELDTTEDALRPIDDDDDPPPPLTGPVTTPSNFRVTSADYFQMNFAFTCGGNADSHNLMAALSGSATWRYAAVSAPCIRGAGRTVADSFVQPGQSYCWKVRASNDTHAAESSTICQRVPDDPRPITAAPGLRILSYTQTMVSFEITDNSTNETGFRIHRRRVGGAWEVIHNHRWSVFRHTGTGVLPRVNDHRFDPDQTWEFRVEAFKEFAPASAFSPEIRITTYPLPPSNPTNFRITGITEDSVSLAWTDAIGEDRYHLHADVGGGYADRDANFGAGVTSHTMTGLPSGVEVCFILYAHNRGGTGTSAYICGTTPEPQPTLRETTVTLQADPPFEGIIPFVGEFPSFGSASGTLTTIGFSDANPQSTQALIFIRPGAPTTDCNVENRRVVLVRGEQMTADELDRLYFTRTPQLPIAFRACASTSTLEVPTPRIDIQWLGF